VLPGGGAQFTSKTDASSGDTSSYQDDQSSLHGGSFPRKNADIESTVDFDRQLLYDGNEVSTKSKTKKRHKHQGYKTPQSVAESCAFTAPGKVESFVQMLSFILTLFDIVIVISEILLIFQGIYDPRSEAVSIAQYDQVQCL
jgi:hypothetical protein